MKLNLLSRDKKWIAGVIHQLYGPRTGPEEIVDSEHIKLRVRESGSKWVPDPSGEGCILVHSEDTITYRTVNLGDEMDRKGVILID